MKTDRALSDTAEKGADIMKRSGIITIAIVGILLVAVVAGYAFHLNRKAKMDAERNTEATAVQKVLLRDLEKNYPPTPKEVVKYFAEITQCFYNEDYTKEELNQLAEKIQGIYDDELIANKTQEDYLNDLSSEIADMKDENYTISSYVLSASVDVEEFVENGYSCARLYCTFNVKQGTKGTVPSVEEFVLRKDGDGHWKIYGWQLADD